MGLMPWGFRRRAPAVLRTRSWRHWAVLFLSIDEGWWAWAPLTVTCTVLSWWGHVLSMTRDALKSSWNWTGSARANVARFSRLIGSGTDAMICFTLADDPVLSHFWRAWHGRKPPRLSIYSILHQRGSSWARFFSNLQFAAVRYHCPEMSRWCRRDDGTHLDADSEPWGVPMTSERCPTTCTIHPNLLIDECFYYL